MIYGCKRCGKKYRIDIEKIRKNVTSFKCGVCGQINAIKRPTRKVPEKPFPTLPVVHPPASKPKAKKTEYEEVKHLFSHDNDINFPQDHGINFGIRAKMIALFILVPVALMAVANLLWFSRMQSLSKLITEQSSHTIKKMAEESIAEKARAVAREVKLYLKTHPKLKKENF